MTSLNTSKLETFQNDFNDRRSIYSAFLGSPTAITDTGTPDGNRKAWENITVIKYITQNNGSVVVPRRNYQSGKVYKAYSTSGTNSNNQYYVISNSNIYICISTNSKNREDLSDTNSTVAPTFNTTEQQTLSDGYTWLKIGQIDADKDQFLTSSYMPVPNVVNDSKLLGEQTAVGLNGFIKTINDGSTSGTGGCGFYYKTATYNPEKEIYGTGGSLFTSTDNFTFWECYSCAQALKQDYSFKKYPSTKSDLSSTYATQTRSSKITNASLNPVSNMVRQDAWLTYEESNIGRVLSCSIDLSNLTTAQKTVSEKNPIVNVATSVGTSPSIRLQTYSKSSTEHIVDGIELVSFGKGLSDYSSSQLTIPTITNASTFTSKISLNITSLDFTNVYSILNADKFAFMVSFRSDEIQDMNIHQTSYNVYGILKNTHKTESGGTNITAFSDKNKNESSSESNVINLNVNIGSSFSAGTLPSLGGVPTNAGIQGTVVAARIKSGSPAVALLEIVSLDPSKYILGETLILPKAGGGTETYTIDSVSRPNIISETGSIAMQNTASINLYQNTDLSSDIKSGVSPKAIKILAIMSN